MWTAHCDTAIQTTKNSILETVHADLQAAASNINALITQSTDPIQQRLNSLEATVEQGGCWSETFHYRARGSAHALALLRPRPQSTSS
ncbi:hypothetical protein WJX77_001583 [Trebouxia sp. C0004]